jgi:hypothetical protein
VDLTSLANPNAAFVNPSGVSGGRRHNLKASGSYTLPYKVLLAANFRLQSGLPITRTWAVPTCSGSVTSNCTRQTLTVNAEPRGSVELGTLPTLDIRAGRFFDFRRDRLDLSVDVYNLTNANTIFGVRNGTGTTGIRVNGDLSQPLTQIITFLPDRVLAPGRVVQRDLQFQPPLGRLCRTVVSLTIVGHDRASADRRDAPPAADDVVHRTRAQAHAG